MKGLPFTKISGSGNDFVLFDNRDRFLDGDLRAFAQKVCHRRLGVGADGILLLEKSLEHDFSMRYFNADGGEAEMCGNGARCIAYFACRIGASKERMSFLAKDGLHTAEVRGRGVKVSLKDPAQIQLGIDLELGEKVLSVHFVNTGVPHAVVLTTDIENAEVVTVGREIRYHPKFAPAGTNADFAQVTGPRALRMRTYERGVEDETLACGTGAAASAILAHLLKKVEPPVSVKTQSGEILTIHFESEKGGVSNVFLEGEVTPAFEGQLIA
jgi:diaminopimelate epimerase